VSLGTKISLWVSLIVLVILVIGNWLIWDKLVTWEHQRTHVLLSIWIMVGVAFAVYSAVRHLTQPLTELSLLAARLGEGHLELRADSETDDEIGRLGRSLDGMAASLQTARDRLEEEVAARTVELQRSQAQVLQAAKLAAVGELAAGVAHEINNPAGIILMRTGQLTESLEGASPEVDDDLDVIRRQVDKISRIVSGMLTFARRTESSGQMSPLAVNEVVERTAKLMDGLLRSRQVEVELDLAAELPVVRADASRLEQVLLNLVNNAIDAMPEGGRITFGSAVGEAESADSVSLFVADTGSGIAADQLARVFDPFYTTKDPGQGTGLGLSVSYAIIEQHGGRIEVTSDPGQGSRFTVYLPVEGEPETTDVE
jgi:two-component system NtrC family sensor kinase